MVITAIDSGLEQLLRRALPLPADLGDISFDAPDRSWGAQLSRVTVNLFLFDVNRSPLPPSRPEQRVDAEGRIQRRPPMPFVRLTYLVSAWAGDTRDEHQLLGDVMRCLMLNPVLPPEHLPEPIEGSVQLSLADQVGNPGDLWSAIDARLKPAFRLEVTAALEAPWTGTAPPVERVEGLVTPKPPTPPSTTGMFARRPPARPASEKDGVDVAAPLTRRRVGAAVVTESRPESKPGVEA